MMQYEAFFFDFDGVLADSVEVKTRAFAKLFEPHGPEIVERVVDHHRRHGGMTRAEKFRHYHREYLGTTLNEEGLADLCRRFAALVVDEVVAAPEIPGAEEFVKRWSSKLDCFVISATPDEEIEEIVRRRGLTGYFKGVFGSSLDKKTNLQNLLSKYAFDPLKCCFFGDAESDYQAARTCETHFIGIAPDADAALLRLHPEISWARDFGDLEKILASKPS
jgi:beta-phosphoglucomutase-like phosphatase (HAD superfamily)